MLFFFLTLRLKNTLKIPMLMVGSDGNFLITGESQKSKTKKLKCYIQLCLMK